MPNNINKKATPQPYLLKITPLKDDLTQGDTAYQNALENYSNQKLALEYLKDSLIHYLAAFGLAAIVETEKHNIPIIATKICMVRFRKNRLAPNINALTEAKRSCIEAIKIYSEMDKKHCNVVINTQICWVHIRYISLGLDSKIMISQKLILQHMKDISDIDNDFFTNHKDEFEGFFSKEKFSIFQQALQNYVPSPPVTPQTNALPQKKKKRPKQPPNYSIEEVVVRLTAACQNNNLDLVKSILGKTKKINGTEKLISVLLQSNEEGKTLLHAACDSGNEEIVALLLKFFGEVLRKDANQLSRLLGALDKNNSSPLHISCTYSYHAITKLLFEFAKKNSVDKVRIKAWVNQKDTNGWTPFHWAAINAKKEIIQLFKDNGGDETVTNNLGKSVRNYFPEATPSRGYKTSSFWMKAEGKDSKNPQTPEPERDGFGMSN